MSQNQTDEACPSDCGAVPTERNRYFTGKYLTARDLTAEQGYFLGRHRLHHRLLHGWGLVCGLRVLEHPNAECRDGWVKVEAGAAIDCCGRELLLTEDTSCAVPLDELPPPMPAVATDSPATAPPVAIRTTPSWPRDGLVLCLCYHEDAIEPVPALYAEGQCDPTHQEPNRVREAARLVWHPLHELPDGCWRRPSGGGAWHEARGNDPRAAGPAPGGTCLDPVCPCGGCVPLALLTRREAENGPPFLIDLRGRRHLRRRSDDLTHVTHINWPHGGVVSLRDLRERMNGALRVRFDRPIAAAERLAIGINRRTFTVEFGGVTRHLEFIPPADHLDPHLEDDGYTAVYPIAPEYLRGRETIADTDVVVTLRCDFIFDCHDIPVDGNHLGGRLPSGDGRPGGDFVSWFRVVHEHHHHGYEHEEGV
jgi:hypothetical protein